GVLQDWGDKICNLPIGDEGHCDKTVWFHNPHGYYTLKSVYSWLLLKEMGFGPHRFFWKALWKLDTLPKVRVFTWRVGHDILPTNVKIASIRHDFDQGCPKGKEEEAQIIWERASSLSKEFCICNLLNEPLLSQNIAVKKWEKPPKGFLKINFDATVAVNRIGYWTIIRDDEGFVLRGRGL
ncbi:hypothetical protein Gohar_003836, partial [Gossypium harknessii]|nr:hypothetical protein [Gossypium harknessii]